jgi:hypothetical protein
MSLKYVYWLLGTFVCKIANFAFSSNLFVWHVKLERGKSRDALLALPEKKPQAYEKNRLYWLHRLSIRINGV